MFKKLITTLMLVLVAFNANAAHQSKTNVLAPCKCKEDCACKKSQDCGCKHGETCTCHDKGECKKS